VAEDMNKQVSMSARAHKGPKRCCLIAMLMGLTEYQLPISNRHLFHRFKEVMIIISHQPVFHMDER
jgi:hypothetical protein